MDITTVVSSRMIVSKRVAGTRMDLMFDFPDTVADDDILDNTAQVQERHEHHGAQYLHLLGAFRSIFPEIRFAYF